MKIIIPVLCVFLSACSASLTPGAFYWAEAMCKANDGLKELQVSDIFVLRAECKNGARFTADPNTH